MSLRPFALRWGTIALVTILADCATPYEAMGARGGYQQEQLAPDSLEDSRIGKRRCAGKVLVRN
jgi:hypothetical protein